MKKLLKIQYTITYNGLTVDPMRLAVVLYENVFFPFLGKEQKTDFSAFLGKELKTDFSAVFIYGTTSPD
jgi:hypothetical protein